MDKRGEVRRHINQICSTNVVGLEKLKEEDPTSTDALAPLDLSTFDASERPLVEPPLSGRDPMFQKGLEQLPCGVLQDFVDQKSDSRIFITLVNFALNQCMTFILIVVRWNIVTMRGRTWYPFLSLSFIVTGQMSCRY